MGMFDTVRSSYPIFGGDWDLDLQTKSLDCILAAYWISPAGELFQIDYSYTQDWIEKPEDEQRGFFDRYKSVPNGNHGHVRATRYWGHLHLVSSNDDDFERTVVFEDGVIVGSTDSTISRGHSPLVPWASR